jgi:hypothetical protein
MSARPAAPSQADAPNRAGPDTPAPPPAWLIHLLVLLRLFALRMRARLGGTALPCDWVHERPDLAPGSTEALAASVRGTFGTAIAWMCLRRGIGPGHRDWPALSRAIVAFGGSIADFQPGLPACGLQWWENPSLCPGMAGDTAPTAAADALAAALARQPPVHAPPPAPAVASAAAGPIPPPAPPRRAFAGATTGPPTGPPCHGDPSLRCA